LSDRPALVSVHAALVSALDQIAPLGGALAARLVPNPPAHLREGGVFRDGLDPELDDARTLSRDAHSWLGAYQARLIEESGIASLKVGFNKVFGYYIEVSKAKATDEAIPPIFVRKQTLKNAERYITPDLKAFEEKVLGAEARAIEREKTLFQEASADVARVLDDLARFADAIAELDCLSCFAQTAHRLGWTRPTMDTSRTLDLRDGRHPVLDEMMRDGFVPNDTTLCCDGMGSLALITGPNMAGKSTYIRQTALIVLLAQAGSFVPATRATIGLVDRIFTRVGANDELHAGRSTFMVEMTEMANILNNATERSLVILDEIGRGTSTLDGLSLAWAIAETLLARTTRTLFATHYHELTSMAERSDGVTNLHVAVREWQGSIVFLHRIKPGRTDRSYGIHVGKLAGLPSATTDRAEQILESLEVRDGSNVPSDAPTSLPSQMSLFKEYIDHPAIAELKAINLETLSPMEAFDTLRRLTLEASTKE
jgi:DNA mismatch repair protein MutS